MTSSAARTKPCKACGKPIILVETTKNWMPCDPELEEFYPGSGALHPGRWVLPTGEVVSGDYCQRDLFDRRGPVLGYRPHWASCPAADRLRKTQPKKEQKR